MTRLDPRRRRAAARLRRRRLGGGGRASRRDPRRFDAGAVRRGAQRHLQRFRKASTLAVALTGFLLMVWGAPLQGESAVPTEPEAPLEVVSDPAVAVSEASETIRDLAYGFYGFLPRLLIVLALLAAAALLARATHAVLRRTLRGWQRSEAASALGRMLIYLLAFVASLSVLAGDVRAVVGSVGLLGLAASWALQTPIESFTGWLLNSFRGYFRVGDRIAVGEVFGDVYRIDILTTTVWEAGGQGKPVAAAQATGALITFPNWEILRSNVVNYSRVFPYVWDEITVNVANESDLAYTMSVLEGVARRTLGEDMAAAAQQYQELLLARQLAFEVEELPRVYLSMADSWTDCTIRYLVPVRTRRHWSSTLTLAASQEMAKPEHRGRIVPVYPRTEVLLREQWQPAAVEESPAAGARR
jgi:small-conductance mechanosensitive channel